jgi:hypothetical protein
MRPAEGGCGQSNDTTTNSRQSPATEKKRNLKLTKRSMSGGGGGGRVTSVAHGVSTQSVGRWFGQGSCGAGQEGPLMGFNSIRAASARRFLLIFLRPLRPGVPPLPFSSCTTSGLMQMFFCEQKCRRRPDRRVVITAEAAEAAEVPVLLRLCVIWPNKPADPVQPARHLRTPIIRTQVTCTFLFRPDAFFPRLEQSEAFRFNFHIASLLYVSEGLPLTRTNREPCKCFGRFRRADVSIECAGSACLCARCVWRLMTLILLIDRR